MSNRTRSKIIVGSADAPINDMVMFTKFAYWRAVNWKRRKKAGTLGQPVSREEEYRYAR